MLIKSLLNLMPLKSQTIAPLQRFSVARSAVFIGVIVTLLSISLRIAAMDDGAAETKTYSDDADAAAETTQNTRTRTTISGADLISLANESLTLWGEFYRLLLAVTHPVLSIPHQDYQERSHQLVNRLTDFEEKVLGIRVAVTLKLGHKKTNPTYVASWEAELKTLFDDGIEMKKQLILREQITASNKEHSNLHNSQQVANYIIGRRAHINTLLSSQHFAASTGFEVVQDQSRCKISITPLE